MWYVKTKYFNKNDCMWKIKQLFPQYTVNQSGNQYWLRLDIKKQKLTAKSKIEKSIVISIICQTNLTSP